MPGHFVAGTLGRLCQAGCGTKLPKALNDAGIEMHPCCGQSELNLMYAGKREHVLALSIAPN